MADPTPQLIDELIEVGRDAVGRGLVIASGGNLSARVPGSDRFAVTGTGTWFDRLARTDFAVMNLEGDVVGGTAEPSSEWKLHQRTYRIRRDVNAIVHLHPQTAVVLDALGYKVRLLTLDHANYLRRVERIPFFHNGSDELADAAAAASVDCDVVILAHHGCSTLGDTVGMAYRRALGLEEAASNTFRCLQLGDTTTSFPEDAYREIHHR
jgi:ribulose-5-phosphate 4-epimerase/fuculose-1-phosphate aldolase